MTDARLPVIDADGHVTEPPIVWTEYVEEPYRGRAPRLALDEHGHPCQVVGDQIAMRDAFLLTLGPERRFSGYTPRAGGFDPAARLADLARILELRLPLVGRGYALALIRGAPGDREG